MTDTQVFLAANNGEIGGGEVMLLSIAEALRSLGLSVTVVAPGSPDGTVKEAVCRGFDVVALPVVDRLGYMRALRAWRMKHSEGILWCNGLLPATATAGMRDRIVHLHQIPTPLQKPLAFASRTRSRAVLVPSEMMAGRVAGATVLHNWSPALERVVVPRSDGAIRLGFLGRPSEAKGMHVLTDALDLLRRKAPGGYRLRVAGEPRFVDARERALVDARMRRLGRDAEQLGWMPADEFFGTIDLLVVPSVWNEPFGLVVTEAMSARVPVIISDAGALPEVVGPDHPWIAAAGDSVDLARVIEEAVAALPADDVVARAHDRWKLKFSEDAGHARLHALLDELGLGAGEAR